MIPYDTSCLGDTAFYAAWLIFMKLTPANSPVNWEGFMKSLHKPNVKARSKIEFLQIIDQPPDSYSTVYITLIECLKTASAKPMVITFDLPLWLKASLHTVRYNEHEWSGVWTDLSIEQRLMKAAKSSGGLPGGRMRTHESAHKLWTGTLNQMALINESVDEAIAVLSNKITTTKASSAKHSDLSKSSVQKNIAAFTKLLCWFKNTAAFDESEDKTKILSYSTGLISQKEKDNVNPEDCISVGTALQKELDGKSFIDKFRVKGKVGNLTLLKVKRTVRVNEKDIVIDSLRIFNRLVFASERESTLEESLQYEITAMPMSLFNNEQMMRKANKQPLGNTSRMLLIVL